MKNNFAGLKYCRYLLLANACLFVAISSVILQAIFDLEPCSLCLIQRFAFFYLGIVFYIAHYLRNFYKCRIIALFFADLGAIVGMLSSGRQLWLSSLPESMKDTACIPNLSYLMKALGPTEAIRQLIFSSGGCGQSNFKIFHFSMAHYSFAIFLLLFLIVSCIEMPWHISQLRLDRS